MDMTFAGFRGLHTLDSEDVLRLHIGVDGVTVDALDGRHLPFHALTTPLPGWMKSISGFGELIVNMHHVFAVSSPPDGSVGEATVEMTDGWIGTSPEILDRLSDVFVRAQHHNGAVIAINGARVNAMHFGRRLDKTIAKMRDVLVVSSDFGTEFALPFVGKRGGAAWKGDELFSAFVSWTWNDAIVVHFLRGVESPFQTSATSPIDFGPVAIPLNRIVGIDSSEQYNRSNDHTLYAGNATVVSPYRAPRNTGSRSNVWIGTTMAEAVTTMHAAGLTSDKLIACFRDVLQVHKSPPFERNNLAREIRALIKQIALAEEAHLEGPVVPPADRGLSTL